MVLEVRCFSCQNLSKWENITRRDECPHCRQDVHVCLNCCFFDESYHHECRETEAEHVKDKDRANFCEYFKPKDIGESSKSHLEDLRKAAQALFKKS